MFPAQIISCSWSLHITRPLPGVPACLLSPVHPDSLSSLRPSLFKALQPPAGSRRLILCSDLILCTAATWCPLFRTNQSLYLTQHQETTSIKSLWRQQRILPVQGLDRFDPLDHSRLTNKSSSFGDDQSSQSDPRQTWSNHFTYSFFLLETK